MIYGVKVIHTYTVGEQDQRFYEELILRVEAENSDEAYEQAGKYMQDRVCDYINIYGEKVSTHKIELIDCFLTYDDESGVEETYSSFFTNRSSLSEAEFYEGITSTC